MINLATRRMMSLNGPAGELWERLAGGAGEAELAAALAAEAPAAVRPAVREFLASLARAGLVEVTGERASTEESAMAPLPDGFVPPRIAWSEELLRFGGACGKNPGAGGPCIGNPQRS